MKFLFLVIPCLVLAIISISMVHAAFPPDFAWGAATASYQIEGAYKSDGRLVSLRHLTHSHVY
jgi:hypothetical protein